MRGSLALDTTGIWDYNLIVVTTAGKVWEIAPGDAACGKATLIKNLGSVHLEGLLIVPDNPFYGGNRSINRTKRIKTSKTNKTTLFQVLIPHF